MNFDLFYIHVAVLLTVIFAAYLMHMRTVRLRAKFGLYRVRDRLILLAADETLNENGRVFTFFYKRVNLILADDHPIGLDEILDIAFRGKKNGDFQKTLTKAKKESEEIFASPEAQAEAVREVIAAFYAAVGALVLSHSNIVRLLYKLSQFAMSSAIEKGVEQFAPQRIQNGIAAVDFAKYEANLYAHR